MAELCHPAWGEYKRSVAKAKLMGCLLKATATTNWDHGPWLARKRFVDFETAASRFVSLVNPHSHISPILVVWEVCLKGVPRAWRNP